MGSLDDNADGKVQLSELVGSSGAALRARFTALDVNHDGGLDANEIKASSAGAATNRRIVEADADL